jgi:hypothetical protein
MHAVRGTTIRYEAIYRRLHLLLFLTTQLIPTELLLVVLWVIIVLIGVERFILLFNALNLEVPSTLLKVQVALSITAKHIQPCVVDHWHLFNLFLVPVIQLVDIVDAKFDAKLEK